MNFKDYPYSYITINWSTKRFICIVLSFHLLFLGIIGFDFIGIKLPILKVLIPFIYLSFIPGVLILKILNIQKLSLLEVTEYSVGLSIFAIMFIGALINYAYPFFGISNPISIYPLFFTIGFLVSLLCIICYYVRDNGSICYNIRLINTKPVFLYSSLFLCMIPLFAILGAYFVNSVQNSFLLYFMILVIAFVFLLAGFNIIFCEEQYPLIIFIISISLLYHNSLISNYLVEWGDTSFEYWFSKLVIVNSIWNPLIESSVNGMLSITMLAPIYSIFCDLSLVWVYKLLYPILYSLVPVCIYSISRKQMNSKISLMAALFFISMFSYYTVMLGLARQQIGEIFLMLIILLIMDDRMDKIKKSLLLILFTFSIIVSHYTLAYIYLSCIISASCIYLFFLYLNRFSSIELRKRSSFFSKFTLINRSSGQGCNLVSFNYIILLLSLILLWYIYVSHLAFDYLIHTFYNITTSVFSEFLSTNNSQGLQYLLLSNQKVGLVSSIYKYLHVISQIFITLGLLDSFKKVNNNFYDKYIILSIPFFGLNIAGIVIPNFAASINTTRLFQISLLTLSPFCITGGIKVSEIISRFLNININSIKTITVFLSIYLLFNTGFVHGLTGNPFSISLNNKDVEYPHFDIYDVTGANWLNHTSDDNPIYADLYNSYLIQMEMGSFRPMQKEFYIPTTSYIFIGGSNIIKDTIFLDDFNNSRVSPTHIKYSKSTTYKKINSIYQIYDNRFTKIYYS